MADETQVIIPKDTNSQSVDPAPTVTAIDPVSAQAILDGERKAREDRCLARVLEVVNEENCRMDAKITIFGGQINGEVIVSAYPAKGAV